MKKGFTLAELLIALAILGVIATFTIPKVLQSQADSQRIAVLKETYSTIAEIHHLGILEGHTDDSDTRDYFHERLNYVRYCANVTTGGCLTWTLTTNADHANEPGYILPNGALIAGVDNDTASPDGGNTITIDWNGANGPNQEGQDQIEIDLIYPTHPTERAGTVIGVGATSIAMLEEIFSN